MTNLSARTAVDLLKQLSAVDISVPLRDSGRTTEHCERWSICRFLTTYASSPLIHYPIQLEKRERPDFVLHLPSIDIGIEITEAVPPDWAWADARRDKLESDKVIFLHRFLPNDVKRKRVEIDKIALGETWGSAWVGDSPEREWADAMMHFALRKAKKLVEPGFDRFSADWLLIYDNWPLPFIDQQKAASYFFQKLLSLDAPLPFKRVFVECEKTIWQFHEHNYAPQPIYDVWQIVEQKYPLLSSARA